MQDVFSSDRRFSYPLSPSQSIMGLQDSGRREAGVSGKGCMDWGAIPFLACRPPKPSEKGPTRRQMTALALQAHGYLLFPSVLEKWKVVKTGM